MCFKRPQVPAAPPPLPAPAPAPTIIQQQTPAAAIPPATERTTEVVMAGRDARIQAGRRKGLRATVVAGDTGAYAPTTDPIKTKTLLGG